MRKTKSVILNKICAPLAILLIMGLSYAEAQRDGGVGDGGGNAVVCRSSDRKVLSAKFLDVYEARIDAEIRGKPFRISPEFDGLDYFQIAKSLAAKADEGLGATQMGLSFTADSPSHLKVIPGYPNAITTRMASMLEFQSVLFLPDSVSLPPLNDYKPKFLPKENGCKIERAAFYNDKTGETLISAEIWNAFDSVDKAAVLLHETLYASVRMNYEFNSDRVRLAVGHLVQGNKLESIIQGIPKEFYFCESERPMDESFPLFEVVFYRSGSDSQSNELVIGQIIKIDGIVPFTKTTFEVPYESSPFNTTLDLNGSSAVSPGRITSRLDELNVSYVGYHVDTRGGSHDFARSLYYRPKFPLNASFKIPIKCKQSWPLD